MHIGPLVDHAISFLRQMCCTGSDVEQRVGASEMLRIPSYLKIPHADDGTEIFTATFLHRIGLSQGGTVRVTRVTVAPTSSRLSYAKTEASIFTRAHSLSDYTLQKMLGNFVAFFDCPRVSLRPLFVWHGKQNYTSWWI